MLKMKGTFSIASLWELRDLKQVLPPFSWCLLSLNSFLSAVILLSPSFWELVVVFIVDITAAVLITKIVEGSLFLSFWPDSKLYFTGVDLDDIKDMDENERLRFTKSLFSFPLRRSLFFTLASCLKIIPAVLVMVFYWEHDISNFHQFLLASMISLVTLSYFLGGVLFYSHIFVSKLMGSIHEKYDWSATFKKVELQTYQGQYLIQAVCSLVALFTFVLLLQWIVISTGNQPDLFYLGLKCIMIGFFGLILFSHNWFLGTLIFMNQLDEINLKLELTDYQQEQQTIALNSLPIIAKLQQSFNKMTLRLKQREHELSVLIRNQTDKSRFQSLGEISGLVAHDLSGPLHVIQFCHKELKDNPELITEKIFLDKMGANVQRAVDLVESLRAKLKGQCNLDQINNFKFSHDKVLLLLKTQFLITDFKNISIDLDDEVSDLPLKISTVDLMHILDNLYRNSFQHMIKNMIDEPWLHIKLHKIEEGVAEIMIADNGLGLSQLKYEQLTSLYFYNDQNPVGIKEAIIQQNENKGVGLRLTRRLVELNKGCLEINQNYDQSGTQFILKLPLKNNN